jgi:hypothetical protein
MKACFPFLLAVAVVSCTRSSADRDPGRDPRRPDPGAPSGPGAPGAPGAPSPATRAAPVTMTHTDPHDPASWTEAQQIAARQGAGEVHKRSDALPFLFQADRTRAVLIHHGAVITQRGPIVAGGYLRDLGVPRGQGPQLDDVLWTLWALDALPKVDPLSAEGYINVPNNQRLADLTARIEWDGQSAHIVLHYFKPEPKQPPDVHRGAPAPGAGGTAVGGAVGGTTRALVRMTLDIPETGDSAWRREDINWADPG